MFKKVTVCLFLILCILLSSCTVVEPKKEIIAPVKVALPDKTVDFFPQDNIIEYVLDSAIKRIPLKVLHNKKVSFLGIETNCKNDKVIESFNKYFANSFEKKFISFVPSNDCDTFIYVTLELTMDFSSPYIDKTDAKPRMMYTGLVPWDDVIPDNKVPSETQYELREKKETMLVQASLIVLDRGTSEILYFDKITCLNIYNSTDMQKQH